MKLRDTFARADSVCIHDGSRILTIHTDNLKRWNRRSPILRMMFQVWFWMKYRMPRIGHWGPHTFDIPGTKYLWRWAVDSIDNWWRTH